MSIDRSTSPRTSAATLKALADALDGIRKDGSYDKIMKAYIKEAMELNEAGAKVARTKPTMGRKVTLPEYFKKVIERNKLASKTFEAFSPSNKKEYVEWITEAKTDETREKRMKTAVEWMAEGKIRNWKYVRK